MNENKSGTGGVLAVLGVACGVIGIFIGGIPLGIIAILCGIAALMKDSTGGALAVLLGVIDIGIAIFVLNMMVGAF